MPRPLQDEIHQTNPFARPIDEALLSILRTATVLDHAQNEALKPHGITPTQYNVLRILRGAGQGGLCGREIAERLISNVPDVSRLLDRMEDMALLRRERDPSDRRHVTARITAKGQQELARSPPSLTAVARARVGRLSARQVASLIQCLAALREP